MANTAGLYPPCSLLGPRSRQPSQFQHSCVRDLAWCLSCPAIYRLAKTDNPHLGDPKQLWQWLRRLDKQPQALLDAIAQQRSHRLGIYFETLLAFTLKNFLKPAKFYYALPVRQRGLTLGEYDFLLRRQGKPALLHLEISIKFYLGLPLQRGRAEWIGPNTSDRLTDKIDKMHQRQLRLSQHPVAQQQLQRLGEQVGPCYGLMIGRLFYPLDKPKLRPPSGALRGHLRGWWLRHSEQNSALSEATSTEPNNSPVRLVSLQRRQWFAPLIAAEAEQLAAEAVESPQENQPGMVARLILTSRGWREHDRGILVEDAWLDSVLEALE